MTSKARALGNGLEAGIVKRARARGLKADRQPGSGVFKDYPHDAVIENLLVEAKVRTCRVDMNGARHFPLDIGWARGVQADAVKAGYEAGVTVLRPKGDAKLFALMDFDFFLSLLARIREHGTKV